MGTLLSAGSVSTPPTFAGINHHPSDNYPANAHRPQKLRPLCQPFSPRNRLLLPLRYLHYDATCELLDVPIVFTLDPYGGGGEMDHRLGFLVDGDRDTTWRTERYFDPLSLIKAGRRDW